MSFTNWPRRSQNWPQEYFPSSSKAGDFWRDKLVWCQRFTQPCLKSSFYDFFLRLWKKCPICWLALSKAAALSTALWRKKPMLSTNENHFAKVSSHLGKRNIGKPMRWNNSQHSTVMELIFLTLVGNQKQKKPEKFGIRKTEKWKKRPAEKNGQRKIRKKKN